MDSGATQQTQQSGAVDDSITQGSGGYDTIPLTGANNPHVGSDNGNGDEDEGAETGTNAGTDGEGVEAPNPPATVPNGPRYSDSTGAIDPGSIGDSLAYNIRNNLNPFHAKYRVMEVDSKLQTLCAADRVLMDVYGDTIHRNDGRHIHGGIPVAEDKRWQRWWFRVVSCDLKLWTPPKGSADGKRFVNLLASEFQSVRLRRSNSEKAMIFAPCILHRKSGVVAASAIKKTIIHRLDLWEAGRYAELVEEVVSSGRCGIAGRKPESLEDEVVSDSIAATFNSMVVNGKIKEAVRFARSKGKGGPLRPDDKCTKTGLPVIEVMQSKHPDIRVPTRNPDRSIDGFERYGEAPMTVPHASDHFNIGVVGAKVQGGAGPSGVDALLLKTFIQRFGTASENLRKELSLWSEWLANESPSWAAIRAINAKRGVALDKEPGTRPLHIGEAYMRLLGKDLLTTARDEAKERCGSVQLCAGLEAGIEGGIHTVREVWKDEGWAADSEVDSNNPFLPFVDACENNDDFDEEEMVELWQEMPEIKAMGLSMFDARNGFNELNRYQMLWNVRHRWPKGSRFAFNCYRHFNLVIVRKGNAQPAHVIVHQEGLSQGDPLAMILYGVALLPLAERLRRAVPQAVIPMFADDAAAVGSFDKCALCLEFLMEEGPKYGYFPEAEKTRVICPLADEPEAKAAFLSRGISVTCSRGERYLGGFIGGEKEKVRWLMKKVEEWANCVKILGCIAKRYPQTAYAGFTTCLQAEWQYVARTTPNIGALFEPVERAIRNVFLPSLLGVEAVTREQRELMAHGVKQAGLAIRNPVDCAQLNFDVSRSAVKELVSSMTTSSYLNLAEHKRKVRAASQWGRADRIMSETAAVDRRANELGLREKYRLQRAGCTGIWLSVLPNQFNGTVLSAEEFRDNIRLRYNLLPLALPDNCDGCGAAFSVEHALSCKVGGLVHIRHDDVAQEFGFLCSKAFKPSRVSYEPLINSRGAPMASNNATTSNRATRSNTRANGVEEDVPTAADEREDPTHAPYVAANENRGDVAVDGFWKHGRRCIFDVRITDTENRSTRNRDPSKVLNKCEKLKKDKHLHACLQQRRDFTPLVYSVDGMSGRETRQAERQIASALGYKWHREYSEMVAFVRARMALAVVRSNSLLLRGSRVRRSRYPLIDEGAAMEGWQTWRERF
jgi:hypothetical protein